MVDLKWVFFFFLVEGGMELTHSNTSTHVPDQLGYIWGRFEVGFLLLMISYDLSLHVLH